MGLTNVEAQACGTPVITFNTGGSPETIDSSTGYVIKKGNFIELIHAINRVKVEGKDKYSEECVSRVRRLYNKNSNFQNYIHLYVRHIGSRSL